MRERIMLGLRMSEGLDFRRSRARPRPSPMAAWTPGRARAAAWARGPKKRIVRGALARARTEGRMAFGPTTRQRASFERRRTPPKPGASQRDRNWQSGAVGGLMGLRVHAFALEWRAGPRSRPRSARPGHYRYTRASLEHWICQDNPRVSERGSAVSCPLLWSLHERQRKPCDGARRLGLGRDRPADARARCRHRRRTDGPWPPDANASRGRFSARSPAP